jgi:hypothetical protein
MSKDTNLILAVGVVEDSINDPLKLGRVRVRIFQYHDDDKTKLPTANLPWASVVYSANNYKTFGVPKEGEWVLCSFIDGPNGQEPVVFGVIPGILSKAIKQPTKSTEVIGALKAQLVIEENKLNKMLEAKNASSKLANQEQVTQQTYAVYQQALKNPASTEEYKAALLQGYNTANSILTDLKNTLANTPVPNQSEIDAQRVIVTNLKNEIAQLTTLNQSQTNTGFEDPRNQSEVNAKNPKLPFYIKDGSKGQPSTPTVSRTVVGTSLDWVNGQLTHECDTTAYIKKAVGKATGLARQIALAIRNALKALLKFLGSTPAAAGIASIIKSITKLIKRITYWVKKINKFANDVIKAIAEIMAVINYILSLPAKLIALFQKCLNEALAELKRGIFDIISSATSIGDGLSLGDDVKNMVAATKELASATAQLANFPTTAAAQLSSGSNLSDSEKDALLATIFPDFLKHDSKSYEVPG